MWYCLASLYSAMPVAPRFILTKPVMPSCLRALAHAAVHALKGPACFLPWALAFFDTTLPVLFSIRLALVSPPLVYVFVPFHTWRMEPVIIFRVIFLGLRTALRAALGALGFDARRAVRRATVLVAIFVYGVRFGSTKGKE